MLPRRSDFYRDDTMDAENGCEKPTLVSSLG